MPRGTSLTEQEIGGITTLHRQNKNHREVTNIIETSKTVDSNYSKALNTYGKKKRTGRQQKINAHAERRLFRESEETGESTIALNKNLQLNLSTSTIRRAIKENNQFVHKKMKKTFFLTPQHKKVRIEWTTEHATWSPTQYRNVIFSDENKFNLDGPDGYASYWHTMGTEERFYSKPEKRGVVILVWGCFSYFGKGPLVVLHGN